MKITIDNTDLASIAAAIAAGVATPESMAAWLYNQSDGYQYAVAEYGVLIPEPDEWHADDGNAEIECQVSSAQEAAEEYVSSGDWGEDGGSVEVQVWRCGIGKMGEEVIVDRQFCKVAIPADE